MIYWFIYSANIKALTFLLLNLSLYLQIKPFSHCVLQLIYKQKVLKKRADSIVSSPTYILLSKIFTFLLKPCPLEISETNESIVTSYFL